MRKNRFSGDQRSKDRQMVKLKPWIETNPKPTAPTHSVRWVISPSIANYIAECVHNGSSPTLFCSLWVRDDEEVSLGAAIPYEYVSPRNRLVFEDFDE